ncbi:2OG-Fe dioxygenase family protein [Vibrio campbellii]|uniref:2OG-Fe dioxygenase family protein n=1 Tax=Vibrio campbellii TaxID=680 RepID=UPI003AAD6E70
MTAIKQVKKQESSFGNKEFYQGSIIESIESFPKKSLLKETFDDLVDDPYLQAKTIFRQRRYSTCAFRNSTLHWVDTPFIFYQTKSLNTYAGGIERAFSCIDPQAKAFCEQVVIPLLMQHLPTDDAEIGVHQIRIIADDDCIGLPAPEGPHQDGFDYICTLCINKHNVAGGNSIVLHQGDIIVNSQLEVGDLLIIDDRHFHHYVSPIVPLLPGKAFRDMFIFTINRERN